MGAAESYNQTLGGEEYVEDFLHVSAPYLVVTSVATVVGTVGNLLVLATLATNRNLHRAGSVFMVNLATADLLVTAFMDPLSLTGMIKGRSFFDDRPGLCDTAAVLCVAVCVCALLSIGAISFQQFIQICRADLYRTVFNVRNNLLFCAGFWLVGLFVALPSLIGWTENVYDPKMLECIWDRTHNLSYTVFYVSVAVFLPLIVISYSYTRIFLHVRASKRRVQRMQISTTSPPNGTAPRVNTTKKDPTRLARTLFVIFVVFAICWTPYSLLVLIDYEDNLPHEVHLFALLLAHLHASADPIVYGLTNRHFQEGYKRIGRFLMCKGGHVGTRDDPSANGISAKH